MRLGQVFYTHALGSPKSLQIFENAEINKDLWKASQPTSQPASQPASQQPAGSVNEFTIAASRNPAKISAGAAGCPARRCCAPTYPPISISQIRSESATLRTRWRALLCSPAAAGNAVVQGVASRAHQPELAGKTAAQDSNHSQIYQATARLNPRRCFGELPFFRLSADALGW